MCQLNEEGKMPLLMSYNATAVTGKERSHMPTDELQCNAVSGKARSQMPADELQCNCCDW